MLAAAPVALAASLALGADRQPISPRRRVLGRGKLGDPALQQSELSHRREQDAREAAARQEVIAALAAYDRDLSRRLGNAQKRCGRS